MRKIFLYLSIVIASLQTPVVTTIITATTITAVSISYHDTNAQLLANHSLIRSAVYEVYLGLGDSKMNQRIATGGTGTATIPTLPPGVAYQLQRAPRKIIPITTPSSLLYTIGGAGGWINQFGLDYFKYSLGRRPVFINSGKGNSKFTSAGDTLSWYTNGVLYDSAKKRAQDALTILHRSNISGVFIMLGVNGVDGATSETTAITSLITRLNTDFSNPPIYISIPHKATWPGSVNGGDGYTTKQLLKALESSFPNVHCTINEATVIANNYTGDGIHFNEKGNVVIGHFFARYMTSLVPDADIKRVLTCNFVNDLTPSEETAWSNFITQEKASGNWPLASFQMYKASSPENKLTDINGLIAPYPNSATISNTGYIETGGTSTTYFSTNYFATTIPGNTTQNSYKEGCKTLTVTTTSGVAASLVGCGSNPFSLIRQTTTPATAWGANANTTNYTTDVTIQSNTEYTISRTASNAEALLKNNSSVSTATTASSTPPAFNHILGGRGVSGGVFLGEYLQAQIEYYYYINPANFSDFLTHVSTLKAGL